MSELEVWFVSTTLVISVITVACILLQTLEIIVPQIRAWWRSRRPFRRYAPMQPVHTATMTLKLNNDGVPELTIHDMPPGAKAVTPEWLMEQSAEDFIKKDLSESIDNFIANHPGTYRGKPPGAKAVAPQVQDLGKGTKVYYYVPWEMGFKEGDVLSTLASGTSVIMRTGSTRVYVTDCEDVTEYRCAIGDEKYLEAILPKVGDRHPTRNNCTVVMRDYWQRNNCAVRYQEGNYVMLPDMRVVWQSR